MDNSEQTGQARASALRAAEKADVSVRSLESTADSSACEGLLAEVWRTAPGCPPLAADVIKCMADAGSYVAGAEDRVTGRLLAACVGLWNRPARGEMHSHIAGVRVGARGREIGYALKLDQRAHVLEQGAREITWTFDPLVARNGHFNLEKLGAGAREYLVDHYGTLTDGLNDGDETDRLLVHWDLLSDGVRSVCDGDGRARAAGPVPAAALSTEDERPVIQAAPGPLVLVTVPTDIKDLRVRRPAVARDWRLAVREVLGGLLSDDARLVGFDRVRSGYVLSREGNR